MSVSGRASQNQGRRTDVREVNQGNAFMQYLVGGVVSARKAMNAPDHTRSNKWAAHVKIQKMNQKQEVLRRAEPTLVDKYLNPNETQGHDQVQFEIPVVDLITESNYESGNLQNPVASSLLAEANDLLDDLETETSETIQSTSTINPL